jgi:predicted Zn-dependent protease
MFSNRRTRNKIRFGFSEPARRCPHLKIEKAFANAVQQHQAGQLPQAEVIYRQILAQQPKHAGALHGLGVIAHQTGRLDIAVSLIRKAIARQPNWPEAYSNLGRNIEAAYRRMWRTWCAT